MYLYVQPAMFTPDGGHAVMGTMNVALVDGQWSVSGSIFSLTTLEPLAITALPGQQDCEGRLTASAFLAELLQTLEELHTGPF